MEKGLKDLLKKSCDNGALYGFLADNYYLLSQEDLRDIAKELFYVTTNGLSDKECLEVSKKTYESLKSNSTALDDDDL